MIHIHGTPISGQDWQSAKFLRGRWGLVSFLAQMHMGLVAEVCAKFVLDNGAYSAWTKGDVINFADFIKWVREWYRHPGFAWAIIPDIIDGDEYANDALLYAWPKELAGVPVWHMHESLERLQRLACSYKLVALGSSGEFKKPGTVAWWKRMGDAMDAICDWEGRPLCQLHGLRMMDPRIFTRLPLASADSTNVGVNVGSKKRFGMYLPPSTSVRASVIADRIESYNSAPVWDRSRKYVKIEWDEETA